MRKRKMWALTWATMGTIGFCQLAPAAEPTAGELSEQIRVLQERLARLEARQSSAADVDATVSKVLADAEARSRIPSTIPFAGNYDKGGFRLRSADGRFELHPWMHFQFRYSSSYREASAGGSSDTQSGFEIRRMKIGFDGNVFSPDTIYQFILAANRQGEQVTLQEGWVQHTFENGLALRGGIFKDPLGHEPLVSAKQQLAVDRSIVSAYLLAGPGYVQGVAVNSGKDRPWQVEFAVHDGFSDPYTDFRDYPTNSWNFGLAGRAQYKLLGDWKQYGDFSAINGKGAELLVVGAGGDWSQGGDLDQYTYTVDAQYELGRWGAYVAYVGRYQDSAGAQRHEYGAVGQLSYLIDQLEPFGRYSYLQLDRSLAGGDDTIHELTIGANYYIHGHNMKFTLDVVYLPNGSPGAGALDYLPATDAQLVLRGQFQLLI